MRIIAFLFIAGGILVFCFWAYHAMIRVRPKVNRPSQIHDRRDLERLEKRLEAHVQVLAGDIGPRNVFNPRNLDASFNYIRAFWEKTGYKVHVEGFEAMGIPCNNLAVEVAGTSAPEKILVVGAHYDTVAYSPGANDNGSAVATLLELSRLCRDAPIGKTLRFVAFVNEEPPFFKSDKMGSLVYAKGCLNRQERIEAMICLETIGFYRKEKGSQGYPFPLSAFYPDRGEFLAIVGNLQYKKLVQSFARLFMEVSDFPVECAALFTVKLPIRRSGLPVLFSPLPGIDWSDHWAFWKAGYPAIMLTDTALFRYPYYHTAEDTPEKLDYQSLARVTDGIYNTVIKMVGKSTV